MQQDTSSSDGENSAAAQQPAATSPHDNTLPSDLKDSILVAYRSIGIGTFGVVMRYAGMPLEKIALYEFLTGYGEASISTKYQINIRKGYVGTI